MLSMFSQLPSRRVIIRRFTSADIEDFCAYQSDPQVREYMRGNPMDVEQAAEYLLTQSALEERQTGSWHAYAVQHVESGSVIGDVGFYLVSENEGDIGFQFHPAYYRQGFGLEAMTTLLPYLFETLGLERVTAGCDQANSASIALLERLGMQRHMATGSDNSYHYDLARDEWLAKDL